MQFVRNYRIGIILLAALSIGFALKFPEFVEWYYVGLVETIVLGAITAIILGAVSYLWKFAFAFIVIITVLQIVILASAPFSSLSLIVFLPTVVILGTVVALRVFTRVKGGFLIFALGYAVLASAFVASAVYTFKGDSLSQLQTGLSFKSIDGFYQTALIDTCLLSLLVGLIILSSRSKTRLAYSLPTAAFAFSVGLIVQLEANKYGGLLTGTASGALLFAVGILWYRGGRKKALIRPRLDQFLWGVNPLLASVLVSSLVPISGVFSAFVWGFAFLSVDPSFVEASEVGSTHSE